MVKWTSVEKINLPMIILSLIFIVLGFTIIYLNPVQTSPLTAPYLDTALMGNAISTAGLIGALLSLQQ